MFKERILMANPAMKIIGKASTEYVDSPATLKGTITKAFGLTLVTIASAIASGVFLAKCLCNRAFQCGRRIYIFRDRKSVV